MFFCENYGSDFGSWRDIKMGMLMRWILWIYKFIILEVSLDCLFEMIMLGF